MTTPHRIAAASSALAARQTTAEPVVPTAAAADAAGIWIGLPGASNAGTEADLLAALPPPLRTTIAADAQIDAGADGRLRLRLRPALAERLAPGHDTLALGERSRELGRPAPTLADETLLAMLASPVALPFPDGQELAAAIRLRTATAQAAGRTRLHFATQGIERPWEHWRYEDARGFTLRPGRPLAAALIAATEPPDGHAGYAFSCYRAGEYVLLRALARELETSNPALLADLTRRWERQSIQSGLFHDVFLREVGHLDAPLPMRWYVPGDRVWFRNPDPASADVDGYEGSWVIYMGRGRFANFWIPEAPFTLEAKCLEVYHWRHAVASNAAGEAIIDEAVVAQRVAETEADPVARARVLDRMMRYRDPRGVVADGGCIDSTREGLRWILPASSDIRIPPSSLPPVDEDTPSAGARGA